MRPRIGITCDFEVTPGPPQREKIVLNADYYDAVVRAGGLPLLIGPPPGVEDALLDALLDAVHGLVFTGGDDLNPARWGEPAHPQLKPLPARRERFEVELFRRADARGVPILAICLGHQVAHVARGGALVQHLERTTELSHNRPQGGNTYHGVQIASDSRLAELVGTQLEVNSRHHQAVDPQRVGQGLRTVATAPDGVVEASEDVAGGRFLVSVQWHPENMIDRAGHLALFEDLVRAAGAAHRVAAAPC